MLRKTIVSCAALVSLAGAVPANADVIKVPCRGGAGGLVRAIKLANSTARADTIRLARGCRYVLTKVDNNWYGPNGLPAISTAVTIRGRGAEIARSRARGTPPFRLFFVGADPADPGTGGEGGGTARARGVGGGAGAVRAAEDGGNPSGGGPLTGRGGSGGKGEANRSGRGAGGDGSGGGGGGGDGGGTQPVQGGDGGG